MTSLDNSYYQTRTHIFSNITQNAPLFHRFRAAARYPNAACGVLPSGERRYFMSLDIFKDINEAEETARKAKNEATALSKRELTQAESDGMALIEKAEREAEEEVSKMLADAKKAGEKIAFEAAGSTENKRAVTKAGVEKRLDQAVDYIVGRIVNG